ncbi:5'/3'-nucleotidase SurE [Pelagibaculum spongiae]|uniref:5'-nucleotidase SurE n=1 Tax=Pelagibaculum spongiae TaxID=2080658 RepID=A0A2V1GXI0_9GAMM|nr:5'/3'-nucleotidase SurE [Pelagibaculum spongiae]PVZ64887.1 5'/3'-nucleotidase SurE [Pelagibaculum spongiae]
MKILISNDDGIHAPGLQTLVKVLSSEHELRVVAPDRNRSAASNSLTLENPLRANWLNQQQCSINGTPTDCVHLALSGVLEHWKPDIVVSGINAGANLGDDVLYSGTVAAATEGRFMGYPAIALSVDSFQPENFEAAATFTLSLLKKIQYNALPADTILNINFPDLPFEQLKAPEVTHLGFRHRSEPMIRGEDGRGNPVMWIGPPSPEKEAGIGTDFYAVRQGHVSITPLQVDMTAHQQKQQIKAWVEGL